MACKIDKHDHRFSAAFGSELLVDSDELHTQVFAQFVEHCVSRVPEYDFSVFRVRVAFESLCAEYETCNVSLGLREVAISCVAQCPDFVKFDAADCYSPDLGDFAGLYLAHDCLARDIIWLDSSYALHVFLSYQPS